MNIWDTKWLHLWYCTRSTLLNSESLFVTKLKNSSLLHYVPNPQGLLWDSCGYFKRKLALAGKQKELKGSKNAQLWGLLLLRLYLFFFFAFAPQANPCCLEITVVQFSLGDGNVMGRGKVREKIQGCKISYSTVSISVVIYCIYIVLYWLTSPVYSPYENGCNFTPSCCFAIQSSFCLTAQKEMVVGLNEIIGRLTCFMTMDHWLTLELHKNNHFYTKCFNDDTRQERRVRLWNKQCSQASGLGRRVLQYNNTSTHAFLVLFGFFFLCSTTFSS